MNLKGTRGSWKIQVLDWDSFFNESDWIRVTKNLEYGLGIGISLIQPYCMPLVLALITKMSSQMDLSNVTRV